MGSYNFGPTTYIPTVTCQNLLFHFRPAVRPDDVRHLGPERGRPARAGAVADAGGRGRRAEDGRPRGEAQREERQGGGARAATQVG